ncbi:MAG: RecQ family ATP-dependent DNA helicase [Bacteroidales bacterium]|nr:RecQ family ATP-dependent DNA helicase [Bacteroidales bacterium]
MADARSLLKRYWGYDAFRPLQEEIVESVSEGHDTLVLLPTGGGKSLCYQMPALMREGICLVVSPLVALMKDQVQQLNDRHLKAACLVAGLPSETVTATLYNAIAGDLKFLYVSPERLRQRRFIEHLRQMKVGLIAVDEAHCVSQWGYDFRPPYLQIADIRAYHPHTPLVALTATATPAVQEDIRQHLLMQDCRIFRGSFVRPNLAYSVMHEGDKVACMLQVVRCYGGSGIVYVRSRRHSQTVAQQLEAAGVTATFYHAGLPSSERDRRQQLWMQGDCRVMVATNAFGMGIDKADVRFVIHLDLPDSLEAYYQEAGRAGRDGLPSAAVLVCDESDLLLAERHFASDFPSLKYIRNVYKALCNYYRLPIGSGADTQFDFDLEALCSTYNLKVREFYSACRFLEREGFISLPEQEESRSTLFIPVGRNEVYRFQVEHLAMGNLLQAALRLYPGLFTEPTPVNEGRIASRSMLEEADVVSLLNQMHAMHVVEYRPRPTKPQIIFLSSRIDEREIRLDESNYDILKRTARWRLDSMRRYVSTDDVCRSRQLVEYFGEAGEPCGRCDVCLKRQGVHKPDEEEVLALLRGGVPMRVNELVGQLKDADGQEVRALVRRMLDEGRVELDENLYLRITEKE